MSAHAFAPAGASKLAWTAVVARVAAVIGLGNDGEVRRPPVASPAYRKPLTMVSPNLPSGTGRVCRGDLGGSSRIAHHPRNPDHTIVKVEEGLQLLVGDRPVVGEPVEAADLEVGGMESREVGVPVYGGAAHRRCTLAALRGESGVVRRILLGQSPDVGVRVEFGLPVKLGVVYEVPRYEAASTQSPWSTHMTSKPASARLQLKALPEAPAPMTSSTADTTCGEAAEASSDPIRRLLVSCRELGPRSACGGQGGVA